MQAEGQGFKPPILHQIFDMRREKESKARWSEWKADEGLREA